MSRAGAALRLCALLVAAPTAACTAPVLDENAGAANVCSADAECGGGRCEAGRCVAHSGEIGALRLAVTPNALAAFGAGMTIPVELSGVAQGGADLPIQLGGLVPVKGSVVIDAATSPSAACVYERAADGSIPVAVELTLAESIRGMPRAAHVGEAGLTGDGTAFQFQVVVPPGRYDVYFRPTPKNGCALPPAVFPGQEIELDAPTLQFVLPPPSTLAGKLLLPSGMSTAGWTLEVVDGVRGRVISTRYVFSEGIQEFAVDYTSDGGSPVVRVLPPPHTAAPRAAWELFALDLENDGIVVLDLRDVDVTPVAQEGRLERADTATPTPGLVRFQSLSLAGSAPPVASFETIAEADESGEFQTTLLPGTYQVTAIPDLVTGTALTTSTWLVHAKSACCGRIVSVAPSPQLVGRVLDALRGAPLEGAVVMGEPLAAPEESYLAQVFSPPPLPPRSSSATAGADGAFTLAADPGELDLTARPGQGTGHPWFLAPRLAGVAPGQAPTTLAVPLPVRLAGTLTDPTGAPLGRALVRAYAFLDPAGVAPAPDAVSASRVLLVGETRTTEGGAYELLIPSAIWP